MHHSTSKRTSAALTATGQVNDNDNIKVALSSVFHHSRKAALLQSQSGFVAVSKHSPSTVARWDCTCSECISRQLYLGRTKAADLDFRDQCDSYVGGAAGAANVRCGGGARRDVRGADQSGRPPPCPGELLNVGAALESWCVKKRLQVLHSLGTGRRPV